MDMAAKRRWIKMENESVINKLFFVKLYTYVLVYIMFIFMTVCLTEIKKKCVFIMKFFFFYIGDGLRDIGLNRQLAGYKY